MRMLGRGVYSKVWDYEDGKVIIATIDRLKEVMWFGYNNLDHKGLLPKLDYVGYGEVFGATCGSHSIKLYTCDKYLPYNKGKDNLSKRHRQYAEKLLKFYRYEVGYSGKFGYSRIRYAVEKSVYLTPTLKKVLIELIDYSANWIAHDDLGLDIHSGNIMVNGDKIVLNDVLFDSEMAYNSKEAINPVRYATVKRILKECE